MRALPLVVSLGVAALVAPAVAERLRRHGFVRRNYRGAEVACPAGVSIAVAAVLALAPLALIDRLGAGAVLGQAAVDALLYVLGVTLLGLVDDLVGEATPERPGETSVRTGGGPPRGWRGHARAAARGEPSTGLLKAAGSLGLALLVLSGPGLGEGLRGWEYVLATGLLVLATNLFNLLDLRPGRSIKGLLLLGLGLTLGTRSVEPLWTLGLLVGPVVALLPLDLRERAMLGDAGSNAVGAVAGLWLVMALPPSAQAVALALIASVTVYGEFRSISALIDRTPLLRHLDSLGRSHA